MIRLNVGGKMFETTSGTISRCLRLVIESGDILFIDHDPDTFNRALGILRGYPNMIETSIHDADVLFLLADLGHEYNEIQVPNWLYTKDLPQSIHTLSPEQTLQYRDTHVLVNNGCVQRLVKLKFLTDAAYTECKVIGVTQPGWVDCQWVNKKSFDLAKAKYRYMMYFGVRQTAESLKE